jgi:multiple sugar transport system ATP-binding protein
MATVELKSVTKSYGTHEVIRGVDLSIADREFVVFLGPSGCGKSTLLRMIAGLEEITGGDLLIDGVRSNGIPPDRRGLAMVFQSYALYPHMSVADNMGFALRLAGAPKAERNARVKAAARILQLEPLLDRKPKQLSGGQRQRVAIGRAIVREPKVFLFDEPLSNLDAALRVQMRLEIKRLHQSLSATMIYVTHDQVEAMTMADRIVVLNAGRIEQVGSPLEVYRRPNGLFVAGFIGSPKMNFISARIAEAGPGEVTVTLPGGSRATVPADGRAEAAGAAVTLGARAEHLAVAAGGDLAATVAALEHLGDETLVYAELKDGTMVVARAAPDAELQPGAAVAFAIRSQGASLFDGDGRALAPAAAASRRAAADA